MRAIQIRGKTGTDGVLHLSVPLGTPEAEFELMVVAQPTGAETTDEGWPPGFFEETAGAWQGELERAPQGEYEKREDL
jgi:hypothetical protein